MDTRPELTFISAEARFPNPGLSYFRAAIRSYFGDGEAMGLDIEYSVEETPLGTAGSVRLASAKLDDTVLVISGDALCDIDLTALVASHRERGASVTIGLKSVENPLEFGIVGAARDRQRFVAFPLAEDDAQVPADEAVGAGDEDLHLSPPARRAVPPPGRG